ncbi:hypothetical protein ACQ4PT_021612 [Festuca glaucescens]
MRKIKMLSIWCSWICEDAPKKKISHSGVWGSNSHDFINQAQSRKAFHLVAVKTVIIKLKWNAQGLFPYLPFWSAHELWTKLQDKYDVSNIIEDDCIASTSGRDEFSSSSTSPMCGKTQDNDMGSTVSPTMEPNISRGDKDEDEYEEEDWVASLRDKASILKENVELSAQLELLTSNYGKLEENHGKLSSSHEDLLASHDRLKLAHEAIISKATPCEPHVDTSTTTQNAILPCASPSNSSTHSIAKSCDELLSLPCCSNNEASTSSITCVVTNHVEEIKELKAQVTSLKNDLVKSHEGKCKLDTMLSVQQSPNDKSGLGFKSNNKNKSKNNNKKKGQVQVKDPAKIVCFKCNIEGHHVRSCPLKKKQKGKRPQAQTQTHIQPQVEERPLPKKNHANTPIVEKSSEKKEKRRTCYICREKGHISSLCTIGTSSNPIIIDDVYSLRKDEGGNVFAKYVGAQSGVKKRTIWVAKPIVTNLLGPNLVGDQQAKT